VVTPPTKGRRLPPGEWHPKAVRWWKRMTASAVSTTWREEDYDLVERGMGLVHLLWHHIDAHESSAAVAVSNAVLRIETVLWLNPTERARVGVKVDTDPQPAGADPKVADIRSRLRALGE